MQTFQERLAVIRQGMSEAAQRSARSVEEVALIAVSKGHPVEAIAEAVAAGQLLFGESRVQELKAKASAISGARWHFIGHLQKNKVRQLLPLVEMVQSVGSFDLAQAISRIAGELGLQMPLLLEVNIGGEESKQGFAPGEVIEALDTLLELPHLSVQGLMTIPPYAEEAESSRSYFVQLRALRDELAQRAGLPLLHLSMGMSHDYTVAVEEGATMVRVGTALFGDR